MRVATLSRTRAKRTTIMFVRFGLHRMFLMFYLYRV
jgi:hypothetical protein